jgi:hypothetical protein
VLVNVREALAKKRRINIFKEKLFATVETLKMSYLGSA